MTWEKSFPSSCKLPESFFANFFAKNVSSRLAKFACFLSKKRSEKRYRFWRKMWQLFETNQDQIHDQMTASTPFKLYFWHLWSNKIKLQQFRPWKKVQIVIENRGNDSFPRRVDKKLFQNAIIEICLQLLTIYSQKIWKSQVVPIEVYI